MAGLFDYDPNELTVPDKAAQVNKVSYKIKYEPADLSHIYEKTQTEAKVAALIGDLDPETTDEKKTKKFFADTKQLEECIAQAECLQDMLHSETMALKVLGILSFGLRKSGELLAEAIYNHKMAKVELKRTQSIASLEKFYDYAKAVKLDSDIDIKATDKSKDHYINIDEDVLKAAEKEALCEAVVSQLDTYKTQFTMAMSGVKAMISKQRGDSLISSVATPTALDPQDILNELDKEQGICINPR